MTAEGETVRDHGSADHQPADHAAPEPEIGAGPAAQGPEEAADDAAFRFDRHLVLEQLGGWRGMVDATLPTFAFIVGNAVSGLSAGVWSAAVAAVLVFLLRLARRQSVQQAISGVFAVAVAVVIAAASGQARNFFVLGIVRNGVIGVVLLASILVRWPLIGVLAEFLAPSHLGVLARPSLGMLRRGPAETARRTPRPDSEPAPERHWRADRRVLRGYSWLTVLWAAIFLARVLVQGPLYQHNEVGLLGTTSLLLGLPVTGAALAVTLWVMARLHRYRCPEPPEEQPAT